MKIILPTSTVLFATFAFLMVPALAAAQANSCSQDYQIYNIPGTYTFTVPADVTSINVLTVGGGGGGGGGGVGSDDWGGGAGGACGGGVSGNTLTVSPGQQFTVTVGAGGSGGGNGKNGAPGGTSSFGALTAQGGGYGGTGWYGYPAFYGPPGGTGGGSGGGGGGNPFCSSTACFDVPSYSGGSDGSQTPHTSPGGTTYSFWGVSYQYPPAYPPTGYCTGSGWSVQPSQYVTNVSSSAGSGGWAPNSDAYCGGGGGGGVVINGSTVGGQSGFLSPSNGYGPACETQNGGAGYGGGGGGSFGDSSGSGGAGAVGVVYIEWNGGASSNACGPSCSVTFGQNPLTSGSTTLTWSSSGASLFYINNIGYVSASGETQVSAPGDYSGYVSDSQGDDASCSAILSSGSGGSCAAGGPVCEADGNLHDSCGNVTSCGGSGCSTTTNECNTSCQATSICSASGTEVVNSCTGAVIADCTGSGEECLNGACIAPAIEFAPFSAVNYAGASFTATGHLQVIPELVQSGTAARLYWNVSNAADCTVTGSNGDGLLGSMTGVWNTLFSGQSGAATSPITGQTVYTLSCAALTGAVPSSVQESATVNIVPQFQEL